MMECDVLAAVAGTAPALSKEHLGIAIYYNRGTESIEAIWRSGQWLWVLRDKAGGRIKGSGYCATAMEAIRMALGGAAPERETEAA